MKGFLDLNGQEQKQAVDLCLSRLLASVVQGGVRFNDILNEDGLQARIDAAMEEAERKQTPWFAHEYIMEVCESDLRRMAQAEAESALYSEYDENVISLYEIHKTQI